MLPYTFLEKHIINAVEACYSIQIETVELQTTRKEFEGDITCVIFPLLRHIKANPVQIGETLGKYLLENVSAIASYNVIKGFLNISFQDSFYLKWFYEVGSFNTYGIQATSKEAVLVEYSSPNTNKPLHLGHIRNILLGHSVSKILQAAGKQVYKTQIINDRGIHICKSMLAWKHFGNNETPESSGLKGDHLVGKYYVAFDKAYKEEVKLLMADGLSEAEAKTKAPILLEAQEMLRKWEAQDPEIVTLWKKLNHWVYDGFDETYKKLQVSFDSYYYESNTYLLGKEAITLGLEKGVFFKKEDGSVWCDLTAEGLDEKLVLRSDGTSVYITQDLGTAIQRIKDHQDANGMVYTVGNEQDYHFKVLFLILKKLGYSWAENLYHLSYGMVDLPSGKMKSREATVVDADDLIQEMQTTAATISSELGKLEGYSETEKQSLYHTIGLGALKYYILKVDPKKRILFNPQESVDFQGNTGPFIQYAYARIQSILRKATAPYQEKACNVVLDPREKEILKTLIQFPEILQQAANQYSPSLIANYVYDLVKRFNSFYQNVSILGNKEQAYTNFRLQLAAATGQVIKTSLDLLGIQAPERM